MNQPAPLPQPIDEDIPASDPLFGLDLELLTALADAVVPADDYPSASAAGGLDYLRRIFAKEQPIDRLRAFVARAEQVAEALGVDARKNAKPVLTDLAGDEDVNWFATLVSLGYYADADNGGNRDARSWQMLGWRRGPAGWPDAFLRDEDRSGRIAFDALGPHYDVIVIGSGAGGGAAASVFAAAGRRVLVVEAGRWSSDAELGGDHLRTPRAGFGFPSASGPAASGHPRVIDSAGRVVTIPPTDGRWSNNAVVYGGGTRVYGAQAWRFTETDFRMASAYGVPEGSSLADWPIGYDDLEPYYTRAEWEMGVAGSTVGDTSAMHRSRDYPMPPLPLPDAVLPLSAGARQLGLNTTRVPLLVNSEPFAGRPACARCAECVGFACPIGARAGSHNTTLAAAIATGRCDIVVETRAARLLTSVSGRVTGVELATDARGAVERRVVNADEIVVAAGAVESARLLLSSASEREPNGLGNNADQVGRHLQGHAYFGATGVFADEVVDLLGPGPAIASNDFRHGNDGIIGGGMLANEFVPTPSSTYTYLSELGLIPRWGIESKNGMRRLANKMHRIVGPVQEVTSADSRVTLDGDVRDGLGLPVPRLHGSLHREDVRTLAFMRERAAEWLEASGAQRIVRHPLPTLGTGPSGGQHQAGTCRMGDDPATSVVDPHGRVWGHDNVRVADGSVHVTNGGVNPVLSIVANALRIADLAVTAR